MRRKKKRLVKDDSKAFGLSDMQDGEGIRPAAGELEGGGSRESFLNMLSLRCLLDILVDIQKAVYIKV